MIRITHRINKNFIQIRSQHFESEYCQSKTRGKSHVFWIQNPDCDPDHSWELTDLACKLTKAGKPRFLTKNIFLGF